MSASTSPSLTSDTLQGMVALAKKGELSRTNLRWVFGFVQSSETRRVARADMGIHPVLVEAEINGATLVTVRHVDGGWEQSFRRAGLEPGVERCEMSPEAMVAQLQVPAAKWADENERFLSALADGTSAADFSSVVVVRNGTRLVTWWVIYDRADAELVAMRIPSRATASLP